MIDTETERLEALERLFLEPAGWLRSQAEEAPVRADGRALPWFTYAAIEFLERVVRPGDSVFEFGAGYSTLWWQERVQRICSVEHDARWCERLRPRLKPQVQLDSIGAHQPAAADAMQRLAPFFARPRRTVWSYDAQRVVRRGLADEPFVAYADRIAQAGGSFDFVVVDGMARRLCTYAAIRHVKADGFVVLDNSNRSDYDLAFTLLAEAGFRQIPFWGLVPGADFMTCTSFFTRSIERLPSGAFGGNSFGLPEY
jgi:predicted O-methyltransferase YrrM